MLHDKGDENQSLERKYNNHQADILIDFRFSPNMGKESLMADWSQQEGEKDVKMKRTFPHWLIQVSVRMSVYAHKYHNTHIKLPLDHGEVNSWVFHMGDPRASIYFHFPRELPAV